MTVGSQVKQTLATLKNIQSTIRTYSLQEQEEVAKATYEAALRNTEQIITDLEERIKGLEFQEPQYKGY